MSYKKQTPTFPMNPGAAIQAHTTYVTRSAWGKKKHQPVVDFSTCVF